MLEMLFIELSTYYLVAAPKAEVGSYIFKIF